MIILILILAICFPVQAQENVASFEEKNISVLNGELNNITRKKASKQYVDSKFPVDLSLYNVDVTGDLSIYNLDGGIYASSTTFWRGDGVWETPITILETAWQNYGSSTTLTGFASTTTKNILYKKIGNTAFISYYIEGTSNATGFQFSIPYTTSSTAGTYAYTACAGTDNGTVLTTPCLTTIGPSSSNVIVYKDYAYSAWTNSGLKQAIGSFFIQVQ